MIIIKGDIIVEYLQEETKESLWELYHTISVCDSKGRLVTIEDGFVTDFASVPKFLWSFIAPIGKFNLASVIHDYYYTTHNCESREFADNEFLKWMDYTNPKTKIRNRIMFYAVRLFGKKRWNTFGNS